MPKRRLHSASTGVCLRRSSIDHRIKCGGDEIEVACVAWHSSGAQPRREKDCLLLFPDAVQRETVHR
jgi:hypothetical protein